jgi:hypothetical protein
MAASRPLKIAPTSSRTRTSALRAAIGTSNRSVVSLEESFRPCRMTTLIKVRRLRFVAPRLRLSSPLHGPTGARRGFGRLHLHFDLLFVRGRRRRAACRKSQVKEAVASPSASLTRRGRVPPQRNHGYSQTCRLTNDPIEPANISPTTQIAKVQYSGRLNYVLRKLETSLSVARDILALQTG